MCAERSSAAFSAQDDLDGVSIWTDIETGTRGPSSARAAVGVSTAVSRTKPIPKHFPGPAPLFWVFQVVRHYDRVLRDFRSPHVSMLPARARPGDRMDVHGGFPRSARTQRSRRDPDGDEGVDHLVSLGGAVDRDRLVQLRLLNRFDDHAAARDLAVCSLRLAARVPDHRRLGRGAGDRVVLALSRSRGATKTLPR